MRVYLNYLNQYVNKVIINLLKFVWYDKHTDLCKITSAYIFMGGINLCIWVFSGLILEIMLHKIDCMSNWCIIYIVIYRPRMDLRSIGYPVLSKHMYRPMASSMWIVQMDMIGLIRIDRFLLAMWSSGHSNGIWIRMQVAGMLQGCCRLQ